MKAIFVSVQEGFDGHEPLNNVVVRNSGRWINDLFETEGEFKDRAIKSWFSLDSANFFHPNITGHQKIFEILKEKIGNITLKTGPTYDSDVITDDILGSIFRNISNFGSTLLNSLTPARAYSVEPADDEISGITSLEDYIEKSNNLLIDGILMPKEAIGEYIYVIYGSIDNYKKFWRDQGDEIVENEKGVSIIDIFKPDVEAAAKKLGEGQKGALAKLDQFIQAQQAEDLSAPAPTGSSNISSDPTSGGSGSNPQPIVDGEDSEEITPISGYNSTNNQERDKAAAKSESKVDGSQNNYSSLIIWVAGGIITLEIVGYIILKKIGKIKIRSVNYRAYFYAL